MTNTSSTNYPQVYEALAIDTRNLGCFMVDTEKVVVSDVIKEEDLYYADPTEAKWVQGIVSEDVPHVTILYGLMRSAKELQWHIAQLLEGFELVSVTIERVGFFHSNQPRLNYKAIIAELEVDDKLREANGRLGMLPHMNTFSSYKPHITLAYVKDSSDYKGYVEKLNAKLKGVRVPTKEWNFGS